MKNVFCLVPLEVKESLHAIAQDNGKPVSHIVRDYLDNIADAPPIAERNFRARIVVKLDDARIAKLAALSRATNTNLSEVFRSIIIKGVKNG